MKRKLKIVKRIVKRRVTYLFTDYFQREKLAGVLLILCTIISLVLANWAFGQPYSLLMDTHINLSFGPVALDYSLEHWVNDGLMAIFFLMVGLEVERELYVGELAHFRKAMLPIAAALGGIALPAAIHYAFNAGTATQAGFAIPMATDIAFALGILALAGDRVPNSVKVFLTALAIIDDICAILVIAVFYTKTVAFSYLLVAFFILGALYIGGRLGMRRLVFFLLPGVVVWYCFLKSGVHATIAGVLLAFVVPFHQKEEDSISNRLLEFLHKPVAYIIMPLFALVNTSIYIPPRMIDELNNANSLGIMIGLIAGKTIGIFLVPFALVTAGVAELQKGITLKNLLGIGMLGGIGFTMAIFISVLAFDSPRLVASSKLSILIASTLAAAGGLLVFRSNPRIPESAEASNLEEKNEAAGTVGITHH